MSGLLNSLHIGQSSIFANQKNMSVIGNNVANANTEGYSRQEVQMEPWPTVERGGLSFGQGVKLGEIARAHDRFVTDRLRNVSEEYGQAEGRATALTELERIIGIDENSLAGAMDDFFDAWHELSVNPEGEAERSMVIEQGKALATRFRQTENSLSGLEDSIDSRLETDLANINDKLKQVADLNRRITRATSTGHNPNTALDNRDRLMQELSHDIGSKVYIDEQGSASVYLPKGPTLVQDSQANEILAGEETADGLQFTLKSGKTQTTLQGQDFGGEFKGYIDVRDKLLPEIEAGLDGLKHDLITKVNAKHTAGTSLEGETGLNFFDPGTSYLQVAVTNPEEVAAGKSDAPGDNETALEIAELKDAQVAGANNNSTFVDAYGKISSRVGVEMKQNEFSRESLQDTLNQLENRRDEVAGVSIDEAMIDLQRYQSSFQASAQFVSTVDEMMQTLLGIKR